MMLPTVQEQETENLSDNGDLGNSLVDQNLERSNGSERLPSFMNDV